MSILSSLNIKSYRGIHGLSLSDLGAVNILVGDNNSGKTSVLEVIRSLESPCSTAVWGSIARREQSFFSRESLYDALSFLANINDKEKQIEFCAVTDGASHCVQIRFKDEEVELTKSQAKQMELHVSSDFSLSRKRKDYPDDLPIPDVRRMTLEFLCDGERIDTREIYNVASSSGPKLVGPSLLHDVSYVSPFQHTEGRLHISRVLDHPVLYRELLDTLRAFDPGIISINADRTSNEYSRRVVYKILSQENQQALPLSVYGDGMKKALHLMSAAVLSQRGVLLVDEFETAIHISAMEGVYTWILTTCRRLNVQLFMTTHSIEAVDKMLLGAGEYLGGIRVIRLKKKNGNTTAKILTGAQALENRKLYDMELRT